MPVSRMQLLHRAPPFTCTLLLCRPLQECPVLVFCSKTDDPASVAHHELAECLQLPSERSRAFQLQPCSAFQNKGIQVRKLP